MAFPFFTNSAKKKGTNKGAVNRLTTLKQSSTRFPSISKTNKLKAIDTMATTQVIHFRRETVSAPELSSFRWKIDTKSFSMTAHAEFKPDDKLENAADRIAAMSKPARPGGISDKMNRGKS